MLPFCSLSRPSQSLKLGRSAMQANPPPLRLASSHPSLSSPHPVICWSVFVLLLPASLRLHRLVLPFLSFSTLLFPAFLCPSPPSPSPSLSPFPSLPPPSYQLSSSPSLFFSAPLPFSSHSSFFSPCPSFPPC